MRYTDYDSFAFIYNQHWGAYAENFLPALQKLALDDTPPPARILDLCCGSGQIAALLHQQGYSVTGLDGSEAMLQYARERAPDCAFILDDARTFSLPPDFDMVVSTYDSLNHIMTLEELAQVFRNVYAALKSGGAFVFDVNMEAGYNRIGSGSFGNVADDHAFIVHHTWNANKKRSQFKLTAFYREQENCWRRADLTLLQTCYSREEIDDPLSRAGFTELAVYDALDVGMHNKPGDRAFFVTHKPNIQEQ